MSDPAQAARRDTLRVEQNAGIAVLTLDRPEVHNAIDDALRARLAAAMAELAADPAIGVLLLTGAGSRAFCAGMDLREFAANPMPVAARRRQRQQRPQPFARFPKPVIGVINGLALGLGLEMALQCDILVAAQSASFALAEVRRGLIPGNGGTQRLARRIGQGRALELVLTGRSIGAAQALAWGLVEYVMPDDQAMAKAQELAREILANAPVAVQLARDAVRRGAEMPLADGLRLEDDLLQVAMGTEDAREGPLAFAQKRAPVWRGE